MDKAAFMQDPWLPCRSISISFATLRFTVRQYRCNKISKCEANFVGYPNVGEQYRQIHDSIRPFELCLAIPERCSFYLLTTDIDEGKATVRLKRMILCKWMRLKLSQKTNLKFAFKPGDWKMERKIYKSHTIRKLILWIFTFGSLLHFRTHLVVNDANILHYSNRHENSCKGKQYIHSRISVQRSRLLNVSLDKPLPLGQRMTDTHHYRQHTQGRC